MLDLSGAWQNFLFTSHADKVTLSGLTRGVYVRKNGTVNYRKQHRLCCT
jgi:hypothetical protein